MDKIANQDQLDQARGLLRICNMCLEVNDRMPLRCLQAFLQVALRPGQSVGEYARQCGLSTSTMSRNLLDIGERDRNMQDGYGLVIGKENPNNRREKEYTLTPRGQAFLNLLLAQIKPR